VELLEPLLPSLLPFFREFWRAVRAFRTRCGVTAHSGQRWRTAWKMSVTVPNGISAATNATIFLNSPGAGGHRFLFFDGIVHE